MTTIKIDPETLMTALIEQEGVFGTLGMFYDVICYILGNDMEWDDALVYNTEEDCKKFLKHLRKALVICEPKDDLDL